MRAVFTWHCGCLCVWVWVCVVMWCVWCACGMMWFRTSAYLTRPHKTADCVSIVARLSTVPTRTQLEKLQPSCNRTHGCRTGPSPVRLVHFPACHVHQRFVWASCVVSNSLVREISNHQALHHLYQVILYQMGPLDPPDKACGP